jgi:hypothetical protein
VIDNNDSEKEYFSYNPQDLNTKHDTHISILSVSPHNSVPFSTAYFTHSRRAISPTNVSI